MMVRGRWFIATREGIDVGPYETREEAANDAHLLAMMLDRVDDPGMARTFIREFERRAIASTKRAFTARRAKQEAS